MQHHRRAAPGMIPAFKPVPRRHRHDGWTPERQKAFIHALADTGSVRHAAARVGMSSENAYMLRRAPGGESFAKAWAAALDHGIRQLEDIALERAIHGVETPVYSYGKLVGTRTVYNDRLIMFMLRNRAVDRFAAGATPVSVKFHERLRAQAEEEARAAAGLWDMDEIRAGILRKIERIERHNARQGKIVAHLQGEEARDFAAWRAARAARLGLPAPEAIFPDEFDKDRDQAGGADKAEAVEEAQWEPVPQPRIRSLGEG